MKTALFIIAIFFLCGVYFLGLKKSSPLQSQQNIELNASKSTGQITLDYLLENYKKPAIYIYRLTEKFQDKASLSYLGGQPTLPEGIEWPKDQHFVAQINLGDLPKNDLLPREGALFFFVDLYEKGYYYEDRQSASSVIFSKTPPTKFSEASLPSSLKDRMQSGSDRDGSQKIFPKWPMEFAPAQTHNIEKLPRKIVNQALEIGVWESYFNYVETKRLTPPDVMKEKIAKGGDKPHQILGYSPPRVNPIKTEETEILLLNLVSDSGVSFIFGDLDYLQFYISKEDLAAQRFDKAWGVAG